MKSILDEMLEDPEFVLFLGKLKGSANYYIAIVNSLKDFDQLHAIDLCIAHAYKAGMRK